MAAGQSFVDLRREHLLLKPERGALQPGAISKAMAALVLHERRRDSAPPLSQPSNKKRGRQKWAGSGRIPPPLLRRPPSAGRAPDAASSGVGPANSAGAKGRHARQSKVPPMSSCAARAPPLPRPPGARAAPSGRCAGPARASSIRVLVCSSWVAAGGRRRAGLSRGGQRQAVASSASLRWVQRRDGERGAAIFLLSGLAAVGKQGVCEPVGGGLKGWS